MLGLGALAILLGIAAVVSSNWDAIPAFVKLLTHAALNLTLIAGIGFSLRAGRTVASEVMLFLLGGLTLTFIALIGQIYQTGAPLWQALTLWLVITSPFLFYLARARFTMVCWIAGFLATLTAAEEAITYYLGPLNLEDSFYTVIPVAMIVAGQWTQLKERWQVWPTFLAKSGYALTACAVSMAQWGWHDSITNLLHNSTITPIYLAFFTGLVASGLLLALRRAHYIEAKPPIIDFFMLVSVLVGFLPFLIPHTQMSVVGAALFMAYWALIGWTGLRLGMHWILNTAIVIIALRLVIVYIEVFGSLLATGVGLIVSGVLLIALVQGTRKLIQKLGRKA